MQPSSTGNATSDGPEAAVTEELITISRWELEALRAAANAPAAHAPEPPPEPVTATAPEPTSPVRDEKSLALERAYRDAIRDRELATALAGRPLVPGAAAQLIKLWRDDFDVFEEGGELKVVARDGRAVGKAVAERLGEAEYAHFRPAASRGGVATHGTGRGPTPGLPPVPRTLGEAALLRWREGASSRPDPGASPIGLRRR